LEKVTVGFSRIPPTKPPFVRSPDKIKKDMITTFLLNFVMQGAVVR
jgi:hypothetical protein